MQLAKVITQKLSWIDNAVTYVWIFLREILKTLY